LKWSYAARLFQPLLQTAVSGPRSID